MKYRYKKWNPRKETENLLYIIDNVMQEYADMGYRLTLRQLYYQLVAKDIIENSVSSYTKIGDIVSNGRLAGYLDWSYIEDRVRRPKSLAHWESASEILKSAAQSFYMDHWENQEYYIEVWCEKDAVSNIIEPVCAQFDVTFMANRGYSSQSALYEAAERLNEKSFWKNKTIKILYLGDHDPSGIDMTRDIEDRLGLFLNRRENIPFDGVERIALNMDQIEDFNPPENPAKISDSRFRSYQRKYGSSSWELDAIDPESLSSLIEKSIEKYLDQSQWDKTEKNQKKHQEKIKKIASDLEDEENEEDVEDDTFL